MGLDCVIPDTQNKERRKGHVVRPLQVFMKSGDFINLSTILL